MMDLFGDLLSLIKVVAVARVGVYLAGKALPAVRSAFLDANKRGRKVLSVFLLEGAEPSDCVSEVYDELFHGADATTEAEALERRMRGVAFDGVDFASVWAHLGGKPGAEGRISVTYRDEFGNRRSRVFAKGAPVPVPLHRETRTTWPLFAATLVSAKLTVSLVRDEGEPLFSESTSFDVTAIASRWVGAYTLLQRPVCAGEARHWRSPETYMLCDLIEESDDFYFFAQRHTHAVCRFSYRFLNGREHECVAVFCLSRSATEAEEPVGADADREAEE